MPIPIQFEIMPLAQTRVIYHWARLEQLDQWWHWMLLLILCIAVLLYVVAWYRRDSIEQQRPVGWALGLLRIAAFAGILLYFLQFDKRTEERVVRNSRVAVLLDTSLSMSLPGTPSESGVANQLSRADEIARMLAQSPVLDELRRDHEVAVYRFDQTPRAIQLAAYEKTNRADSVEPAKFGAQAMLSRSRWLMVVSLVVGLLATISLVTSLGAQLAGMRTWTAGGWLLLLGAIGTLFSLSICAWAILPASDYPMAVLFGTDLPPVSGTLLERVEGKQEIQATDGAAVTTGPIDWSKSLTPTGIESRIGDAIKSVLDREQGSPLAALIIATDGRSNAGLDPKATLQSAQNARVPLVIIGLGSPRSPPTIKLVEIDAPKRLYPGDKFSLSAMVQSSGYAGKSVTLQVLAGPQDADPATFAIEDEQPITLPGDDALSTARFELKPKAVGEWTYMVKIASAEGLGGAPDNSMSTTVRVIERKNRVLIFSGGPSREYQFVRNLLFRDRDVESHVLLQTGRDGMSQEAQKILTEFPADRAALTQYDAILAFDADWTKVSDAQAEALELWVAEQAGGLMLIAGSVEMPKWLARAASGTRSSHLRSLSPVVLDQRGSQLLVSGRTESESAWPVAITPDGLQSDFLWLNDDPVTSGKLWDSFKGIFSFFSAYQLKPGAKALALFSDPTAKVDGQLPIYLASHFYGAGRVVFQGGSEMWRLREVGDQYFDRYYTKLVRWISQGRLLLDSDRGVLLVDREQALLGDQVTVRAVLKDERFEPLIRSEVVARLVDPLKRNGPLMLRPLGDGTQPGVYTGQFSVQIAGEYAIQLQLGGMASGEILTATVKAKIPAVEMQRAERFDELLGQLAVQSGGKYLIGVAQAVAPTGSESRSALSAGIVPQDQVSFLPGVPDRRFQLRWLGWLMAWIAGSLSLEWLSRRLHRLA